MNRTNRARLGRCLDRLDDRAERQTFLPGADRRTVIYDNYQEYAGAVERRVLPVADDIAADQLAQRVRVLRAILRRHAAGGAS